MNIFDLVTSADIAAYWTEVSQSEPPYIGEELFPTDRKRGLNLSWIKGSKGLPVVLKNSAFDVYAVPRPRIGFERMTAQMPYFKESTYIDEELRQELNMVLESGNQNYIDSVVSHVFDDNTALLRGAAAARERMRMMALTTGSISLSNNGQVYTYDYGLKHKGNAATSWSDPASDPLTDIRTAREAILDDTGEEPSRAMCSSAVWRQLLANEGIKKSIYVLSNGIGAMNDRVLHEYLLDQTGTDVLVNDKRFIDEAGKSTRYMPDDTFVMFPAGTLGRTWMGTTPAESDLMGGSVANVSIVDNGVAVTTTQLHDPVNVEVIVSQICLPSFERADEVYILDTKVE